MDTEVHPTGKSGEAEEEACVALVLSRTLRAVALAAIVALIALLAAPRPPQAAAAGLEVAVGDNWFGTAALQGQVLNSTISTEDTISWGWVPGAGAHRVSETDASFRPNGGETIGTFDSSSGPASFATPGTYYYVCTLHPDDMRGTVTVAPASTVRTVLVTITLTPGALVNIAEPVQFPAVALTGADRAVATSPSPWQVTDATGSAAGWRVTVSATTFVSTNGVIPTGNLAIRLLPDAITLIAGTSPPTSEAPSFVAMNAASPLKLLSAAPGAGSGSFRYEPEFQLIVPAAAPPGEFTASLLVSVIAGP